MDQPMTQSWSKIRERYAEKVGYGLPYQGMLRLVEQIEQSKFANGLFAWTSMHDLCIVQTPVSFPYYGPCLRISPRDNGTIEFRYIDTYVKENQWHRVVHADFAFERLVHFTEQLHWFVPSDVKSTS